MFKDHIISPELSFTSLSVELEVFLTITRKLKTYDEKNWLIAALKIVHPLYEPGRTKISFKRGRFALLLSYNARTPIMHS